MNFLLAPNITRPDAVAFCEKLARRIGEHGDTALATSELNHLMPALRERQGEKVDCAVILGGDGTILRGVQRLEDVEDMKVWSINFGHLGYLTDCGPDAALERLERIFAGEYDQEKRTMLRGALVRQGREALRFRALNEACAYRAAHGHALRIRLLINGNPVREFAADGLITATASGSTAYNYSAGGPVLTPEAEGFVLTPICARPADSMSLVTGGAEQIAVEVGLRECGEADEPVLEIDGCRKFPLMDGDRIELCAASKKLTLLRTDAGGFYARLRDRLRSV